MGNCGVFVQEMEIVEKWVQYTILHFAWAFAIPLHSLEEKLMIHSIANICDG